MLSLCNIANFCITICTLRFKISKTQVTKVRQQEKLKKPPNPLNTIQLEQRASIYFRMSSEHTMKVSTWATMLS